MGDEIVDYADLHMDEDVYMVADMDLNSYGATYMVEDSIVATNAELDVGGVDSLVLDVGEGLHDTVDLDLYLLDVDPLVIDMAKDLHVSLIVDLSLHVSNFF